MLANSTKMLFFIAVIIFIILNSFRPFSSIYPFNERDDVCLKIFYLYTFFFLGEEVVSEVFLQGLFRHRHFSPFYYFYRVKLSYSVTKPTSLRSCNLSVVLHNTCIFFVKRPSELGLNVTMISLVCPGRTGRFSHCGLVQPQVVSTFFMRRGCEPVFFRVNIACGFSS